VRFRQRTERTGRSSALDAPKKVPPPTLRRSMKGGCSPQNSGSNPSRLDFRNRKNSNLIRSIRFARRPLRIIVSFGKSLLDVIERFRKLTKFLLESFGPRADVSGL
jgi:hypothetical protein